MPHRRILLASTHQLSCYRWRAGVAEAEALFDNTAEGVEAFGNYLAATRDSLFTLVVNLAEESFVTETIPYLHGKDRAAVVRRKLSQLFFNTPFVTASSLGYEKTRRKDERLLLAALADESGIEPWVDALRGTAVALTGIHSLPFLSAVVWKKLKLGDERGILLTIQNQSIRESFFENGQLHFSRLSPLTHTSIGGIAQSLSTEAVKLQQYLLSQRLIARNQPLRAVIVAHRQAIPALDASCVSTDTLSFRVVTTEECCSRLGLRKLPDNSQLDELFAHIAATAPPRDQFAPPELRHPYRLWQASRALVGIGVSVLLACTVYAAHNLYRAGEADSAARATRAQAQETRDRYERIRMTFPPMPIDNDAMRQLIDSYTGLTQATADSPEKMYRDIANVMDRFPGIAIDDIQWKTGAQPVAGGKEQAAAFETAVVSGTVAPQRANSTPRQTLSAFGEFVSALKANPRLTVKVLQHPYEIESSKPLSSSADIHADSGPKPFRLEIAGAGKP